MAVEVRMPLLGDVMQEGTLVEWLQPDGVWVEAGTPLFSVETDKAVVEVQAPASGHLRQQARPGDSIPVGGSLGQLLEQRELAETPPAATRETARTASAEASGQAPAGPAPAPAAPPPAPAAPTPPAPPSDGASSDDAARRSPAQPVATARLASADDVAHSPAPADAPTPNGAVRASPLARRVAAQHGIDLRLLRGTGPNGRIVEVDVRAYLEQRAATSAPVTPASTAPASAATEAGPPDGATLIPLRGRRRTIADRMHASLQSMAQLTIGREVEVTRLVDLRAQLVERWEQREGVRVTITDLIVKAVALALREHPDLNAHVVDDTIRLLPDVNVAIAVDAADGLTVPVLRNADRLPLLDLARETKRLAEAARSGRLSPADLADSTFTVSAMGSVGIDWFTPIINPPQVAILGVGRIRPRPALEGGRIIERQILNLCLTFDHRAVDGAPAARFLEQVANLLATPVALLDGSTAT